jgi:uncharacterized protein (TIGR00106 family)
MFQSCGDFLEKNYTVIADFSIFPIGHGETSVGSYVAEAINAFKKVKGLNYEVTPMGTILEASNLETIFEAAKVAHEAMIAKGILRVVSNLRIDDRRDKPRTMKDKVNAVKKYMKSASA